MRRPVYLGWYFSLWIMAIAIALGQGQQAQPVANVLDVAGNWKLEGQQGPVKAGQPLYAGSKLSTAAYNYDNSITIVQNSDASRKRIACENSPNNPCLNPIVVNSSADPQASQFRTLLTSALNLLLGNPPAIANHYSATIGRGKYIVVEREDVASLNGGKGFSLTGMIPALPAGTYSVDTTSNDEKAPLVSAQVATGSDGSWQSVLPLTVPGLYMISVKDVDGERRADLVILFVEAAEYSKARQTFDAVKERTSNWQGANAQADEHTLLRVVLLAMSQSS
jgi:hypothetical protein